MHVLLPYTQVIALLIGALVPAVTYVLNHYAPWVTEKAKAVALVITAAVAAGLYQALDGGTIGWNNVTLQLVVSAVAAAFAAHHWFWKPSTISTSLGAGSNAGDKKI